jgi:ankyrin repeat protein
MGAAFSCHAELVRKLLGAGAAIEALDRVKKNAATYAAGNGCSECLQELIRVGMPVNAVLDNELTLLMWAAGYGHEDAVRLLLKLGANRSLKDGRGKTAEDMAREGGHSKALALLVQP